MPVREQQGEILKELWALLRCNTELTRGEDLELYSPPGVPGMVVFQVHERDGVLQRDWMACLVRHPKKQGELLISNTFRVSPNDDQVELGIRLQVEAARLVGYVRGRYEDKGLADPQPREVPEGEDMGAPYDGPSKRINFIDPGMFVGFDQPAKTSTTTWGDVKREEQAAWKGRPDPAEAIERAFNQENPIFNHLKGLKSQPEPPCTNAKITGIANTDQPVSSLVPAECTCQKRYGHREHALDCPFR